MGSPRRIDPTTHRTMSKRSYHGATSRSRKVLDAISLDLFLYLEITLVWHPSCPSVALHDIPSYFITIILYLSSVDSLSVSMYVCVCMYVYRCVCVFRAVFIALWALGQGSAVGLLWQLFLLGPRANAHWTNALRRPCMCVCVCMCVCAGARARDVSWQFTHCKQLLFNCSHFSSPMPWVHSCIHWFTQSLICRYINLWSKTFYCKIINGLVKFTFLMLYIFKLMDIISFPFNYKYFRYKVM